MTFHTLKNANSSNFDSPNFFRKASEIMDGKVAETNDDIYEDIDVKCVSLDEAYYDQRPTLIKINALAADYNILKGARRIIVDYAPMLVMDYGARPEFIRDTLVFLRESRPDYKLFLREKKIFGDYKTILYAKV